MNGPRPESEGNGDLTVEYGSLPEAIQDRRELVPTYGGVRERSDERASSSTGVPDRHFDPRRVIQVFVTAE